MGSPDSQRPRARTTNLLVEEVSGETVVYDLDDDTAHCLNALSAAVWRRCDGRTPVGDMAGLLSRTFAEDVPLDAVWAALSKLQTANLLEEGLAQPALFSRRAMMRGIGVVGAVAVAAPVISTLKVPAAAVSGSCVGGGETCSNEAHSKLQCCQGFVCCDNSDGTKTCSNTGTGCTPVGGAAPTNNLATPTNGLDGTGTNGTNGGNGIGGTGGTGGNGIGGTGGTRTQPTLPVHPDANTLRRRGRSTP